MKLAYLVNQYPKVSHTFVRREIEGLEAEGHEVVRVSVRRPPEPLVDAADQAEEGRTHYLLETPPAAVAAAVARAALPGGPGALVETLRLARRGDRGPVQHAAYLAEACLLRDLAAAEGVAHVHVHFGTNSATVALLCRRLGGPPFSFTVHGPEEFDRAPVIGLAQKIEAAAFTVAISEYGRSQLYRQVDRAHWDRIHVVRCGLDAGYLEADVGAPPDAPRLVFVGRLSEQKGAEILVEAAARLHERGRRFELVMVGDGERRGLLEGIVAERGLGDVVRITGWADAARVRRELTAARALVLPSFAEGLPVVLMEALALGRPAISTYVAGIPELVRPGENGWLVPAGAVEPLVAAMSEALDASVEDLARLGAAGSALARERHDARRNARDLGQLFEGARDPSPAR